MENLKNLRISSDYRTAEATYKSLLSEAMQYANSSNASDSNSLFMVKIKAAYSAGCAAREAARVVVEAAWEIYQEAITKTENVKRSWFYNWIVGYEDERKSALATFHALKADFNCLNTALIEANNTINEMQRAEISRRESKKAIVKATISETKDFTPESYRITHCFKCKRTLTSSVTLNAFHVNGLNAHVDPVVVILGEFRVRTTNLNNKSASFHIVLI